MWKRALLMLPLCVAGCGGGNEHKPEPSPAANQADVVDTVLKDRRRAIELRDRAAKLITDGDNTGAAELAEQAVKLAPDEPTVHDQLGFIYENLGRYDDAMESYARAGERFDGKDQRRVLSAAVGCALKLVAKYQQAGKLEEAEKAARRGIEISPDSYELTMQLGKVRFEGAIYDAAAEAFDAAANLTSGAAHYEALSWRGQSEFFGAEYEKAVATYTRLIDEGVTGYEAYGWRAYSNFKLNRLEDAENDFQVAAAKTTNPIKRGDYEEALKQLAEHK
ncbi:MAG: tetratricopeptide repeat protein [Planctomycetes bacterium]|nr:tetratricopeptide repeat protein [Planctomycetota bacterium]